MNELEDTFYVVLLGPFLSVAVALCFAAFTAITVRISFARRSQPSITLSLHLMKHSTKRHTYQGRLSVITKIKMLQRVKSVCFEKQANHSTYKFVPCSIFIPRSSLSLPTFLRDLIPEDGGSMFLRNVDIQRDDYTAQQPRKVANSHRHEGLESCSVD
jgi:hypothetical protein